MAIVPASDEELVLKLQTCNRVVVRAELMNGLECLHAENDDAAVGSTRHKLSIRKLELSYKGGVALDKGKTFAIERYPVVSCPPVLVTTNFSYPV